MSMPHEIVRAEPRHVMAMVGQLRAGDAAEVSAAGATQSRALWRSYRKSIISRAALVDGEMAAIWGVAGCPLGTVGATWLLTTPTVEKAKIAFIREARLEVAWMLEIFPELRGICDARYGRALRLLTAHGFKVGSMVEVGDDRVPFMEYSARRF